MGLSEEELLSLFLQEISYDKDDIRDAIRLCLRQVRPFLALRDGRHDFFYQSFRLAAIERYVAQTDPPLLPKKRTRDWHAILVRYFQSLATWKRDDGTGNNIPNIRKVAELPYHQTYARVWTGIITTLTNIGFIEAKSNAGKVVELIEDFQRAEKIYTLYEKGVLFSEDKSWADWKNFLISEQENFIHFAMKIPQIVLQQVYNSILFPEVAKAAKRKELNGQAPTSPWFRVHLTQEDIPLMKLSRPIVDERLNFFKR